jgi:hypothetical protein
VGEDNPPGIELLKASHPCRCQRQASRVLIAPGPPGQDICAIRAGRVVALPGYYDGPVFLPYHHRLVPGSVARSGDHEDPGHDLGLAVQYFVTQPGRIDQVGKGVVDGPPGRLELSRLNRDGPASQLGVAAAMVEVEVAVDNQAHVLDADPASPRAALRGWRRGR